MNVAGELSEATFVKTLGHSGVPLGVARGETRTWPIRERKCSQLIEAKLRSVKMNLQRLESDRH